MQEKKLVKVLFRQADENGDIEQESVWAQQMDQIYQIENIPFFINEVSYKDKVAADKIDGELFATKIVEESGNSTIRIYLKSVDKIDSVGNMLKKFGCSFELGFTKILAVNIPEHIDYPPIKKYLDEGEDLELWEYDEGCLANNHQYN